MRARVGVLAAAACRCPLRRRRHGGISVMGLTSIVASPAPHNTYGVALVEAARCQAAVPERRFHCSVCKKAFRLEMAAKLHLQQVHSGDGTVESGAGPGQVEEAPVSVPVGVFRGAPPQAPTVVSPILPDHGERPARREKPAPKPLHQAEREVAKPVMEKMLSVWDTIGVHRMGSQFVHSSMVMRVFAARPSDDAEPLYGVVNPEGENPFHSPEAAVTDDAVTGSAAEDELRNFYRLSLTDAFAMATNRSYGPMRPARCLNPLLRKLAKEMGKAAPVVETAEQQTAPVTPFGQLPLFGQQPAATPTAATGVSLSGNESVVSSPFATGTGESPFAGTVDSPFAGKGYSPFAPEEPPASLATDNAEAVPATSTVAASPLTDSASFTSDSPFAAAAAAPSPFLASPFVSSPFTAADTTGLPEGNFGVGDAAVTAEALTEYPTAHPAEAAPAPQHVCSLCEKSFSTHDGLRMHSKAKHSREIPKEVAVKKKNTTPELPAFIPSPVDLTMTTPFGAAAHRVLWEDVELTPYANSVSNITIAGKVIDVCRNNDGSARLRVVVIGTNELETEVIAVNCSAAALGACDRLFVRGDYVFACGSLHNLPIVDEITRRTYSSPVVHVAPPTGVVARLR